MPPGHTEGAHLRNGRRLSAGAIAVAMGAALTGAGTSGGIRGPSRTGHLRHHWLFWNCRHRSGGAFRIDREVRPRVSANMVVNDAVVGVYAGHANMPMISQKSNNRSNIPLTQSIKLAQDG